MPVDGLLEPSFKISLNFLQRQALRCVVDVQSTREPEIAGLEYDDSQIADPDDMD